jgi:hypothetical protein
MINYQMPNAFPIAPDNYRDGSNSKAWDIVSIGIWCLNIDFLNKIFICKAKVRLFSNY